MVSSSNLLSFEYLKHSEPKKIIAGAERLDLYLSKLKNKKVGLVVNQTSLINNVHLVDTLLRLGINIERIFSPEHGFRGNIDAGTKIDDSKDENTGLNLISLYGKKFKPSVTDLVGLDLIIFDIQDVGVRFFTYISTLHYVMESCAENNLPLIVLDRPNPNAHYVDGPLLEKEYKSFVGLHPIPIVYGLTIGELAKMIKGECWINSCQNLSLSVIACKNYAHASRVILPIKPSPNLPNELSILLYPSICLFEGTVVSLGRGTSLPFQCFGHPSLKFNHSFNFTPRSIQEAKSPPWQDSICYGVNFNKADILTIRQSKQINLNYLIDTYKCLNMGSDFFLKNNFIDKLYGSDQLRKQILLSIEEKSIRESWKRGIEKFKKQSQRYKIYP